MLTTVLSGFVFFPGLFFTLKHIFKTHFKKWKDADVALISERMVSSIHAIMASTAGVLIVASCSDIMTDRHRLATDFVLFGAPYMAYDIYAMYQVHYLSEQDKGHEAYKGHSRHTVTKFLHKDFLLVLHHIALITIFMPVTLFLRRGLGDFFIGCFFTTELSTPFVSIGKVLIQLGLQDSTLHKINGLMVLLTFFLCRILLFPFMYWVYGRNYNIPFHQVALHLPLHCNIGNLCILAPQVYWFILLCRKARRLYHRQHKKLNSDTPKTK
ncbi:TLC domain-containing protein 3A-like [Sardina pilchardus]|uniref:TLC domain-containing protein 3A-like n=1 Tax=Sardina pilchardus TaxID=27697 RepID=UPI002E0DD64A